MQKSIHNALEGIVIVHTYGEVSPDFWEMPPHSHEHCEVFVHICGQLDIFVEQNLYHLSGEEIRVYRSNELHCGKSDKKQYMEWYQISIPLSFFCNEQNSTLGDVLFKREAGTGNVFGTSRFQELVSLLKEATDTTGALSVHYCHSAVLKLLCIINEKSNPHKADRKNESFKTLTDAVRLNFKEISSVEDLSELTHYSSSYINKIFKEHLSITPYRFIIGKKLNEAKGILSSGGSATDACEYAGFNDYANFITLFKKHFGITPKQWAKEHGLSHR